MKGKAVTKKEASAVPVNLSLIYSRLADLDGLKVACEEDINIKTEKLDETDIELIEKEYHELIKGYNTENLVETLSKIKEKLMKEETERNQVLINLTENTKKLRALKREKDIKISEVFRYDEKIILNKKKLDTLGELCRTLQSSAKEKHENFKALLEAEKEKNIALQKECDESLSSVSEKIDKEETELENKNAENIELRNKLDQFKHHLELRRENVKNQIKMKKITAELETAKKAQKDFIDDQKRLRKISNNTKIAQLQETITQYKEQISMYESKFDEFNNAIIRNDNIVVQLQIREDKLFEDLAKLTKENQSLKTKEAPANVSLITAYEQKQTLQSDVSKLRTLFDKVSNKCRKLQARRKELTGKGQTQTKSSSSSSSTAIKPNAFKTSTENEENQVTAVPLAFPVVSTSLNSKSTIIPSSSAMGTSSSSSIQASRASVTPTNDVLSSSSSPARPQNEETLVGDGSPCGSPRLEDRKQMVSKSLL